MASFMFVLILVVIPSIFSCSCSELAKIYMTDVFCFCFFSIWHALTDVVLGK